MFLEDTLQSSEEPVLGKIPPCWKRCDYRSVRVVGGWVFLVSLGKLSPLPWLSIEDLFLIVIWQIFEY